MGADIYLRSVHTPNNKKYSGRFYAWVKKREKAKEAGNEAEAKRCQERVSYFFEKMDEVGYFRDSYNGTSLFQRLGLSWWGLTYDADGNLPVAEMVILRAKILETPLKPITKEELLAKGCSVDEGDNSPEAWQKMFDDKRERFLKMLDQGIELGEPLYCSV